MSLATTGVPCANASVRTIPKLSPPSDGAHRTSASRMTRDFTSSSTRPRTVTPRASSSSGSTSSGDGADDRQLGVDVLAQPLEGAQQHRQALALDGLADERDPQAAARRRRALGASRSGTSTPLGTMS